MPKKTFKNLFLAFLIAASSILAAQAQTPTPTPKPADDEGDVLRVTSTLVTVPVSVTDANGEPVKNLTKTDFRLEEENRPQQIEEIGSAEQVPLEIALLFDVSSSVNKIFELQKEAAAKFLQGVMKPEDRATIFLIGQRPILNQTRETAQNVAAKLRAISPATQVTATAFYDTVTSAADFLRQNSAPRSRRVVVVISDGEDNYSSLTRESEIASIRGKDINTLTRKDLDARAVKTSRSHSVAQTKVLRDLQNADTVFYSINPSGPSVRLNVSSTRAQNGMQRFADETGGTAFLPQFVSEKSSSSFVGQNSAILERIFRQISAELRAQYLLQYYSETDYPAGKYVKLQVGLNSRPALKVRARQGYFAKSQ